MTSLRITLWLHAIAILASIITDPALAGSSQPGGTRWELPSGSTAAGFDSGESESDSVIQQESAQKSRDGGISDGPAGPLALAAGLQNSTSADPTPEIVALARALKNDVDLIYEYVYNEIEFVPIFGSNKGAMGTLIDKSGNSFDQTSLMVALLRAAGYAGSDVEFVYGSIRVYPDQLNQWLGVDLPPEKIGSSLKTSSSMAAFGWARSRSNFAARARARKMSH